MKLWKITNDTFLVTSLLHFFAIRYAQEFRRVHRGKKQLQNQSAREFAFNEMENEMLNDEEEINDGAGFELSIPALLSNSRPAIDSLKAKSKTVLPIRFREWGAYHNELRMICHVGDDSRKAKGQSKTRNDPYQDIFPRQK